MSIGPQLPPHLIGKSEKEEDVEEEDVKEKNFGPSLPPGFKSKSMIGPALPPDLVANNSEENEENDEEEDEEEEDSEVIGPCLPHGNSSESENERIKREFEDRAKSMKNKLTGKVDENKKMERESWMLELPPALSKNFGLGPRSFRAKAPELGDRSVWTDTPEDIEKKKQERRDKAETGDKRKAVVVKPPSAEDLEMKKRVEQYNNATRPQSLMEMHQDKRKKTEDTSNVRRPFDRDRDLAINRNDPKEKANFISKAKLLDTKFSAGSYSKKFL